jgi:hypothetical protein
LFFVGHPEKDEEYNEEDDEVDGAESKVYLESLEAEKRNTFKMSEAPHEWQAQE